MDQALPSPIPRPSWAKARPHAHSSRGLRIWLLYLVACLLSVPILQYLAIPRVPLTQQLLAYLLLFLCTRPVAAHLSQSSPRLPVFPIICLVYGASYALPVFFVEPILVSSVAAGGMARVSNSDTTRALELGLLGVASMQVGFWIFRYSLINLLIPKARLRLEAREAKRLLIPLGFLGAFTLWLSLTNRLNLPPAYGYIAVLVTKFASLAVGLLYLYYLKGDLTTKEKLAFVAILAITELLSVASSNFRVIIDPAIVMAVVYWMVNRKFPWTFFAIGALLFGLLQPVKSEYRDRVWKHGYSEGSVGGRLALWGELIGTSWYGILHGRQGAVAESARGSLSRTDIIHMFARVLSMTPRYVPYQHGNTYSYLLYALIPRALWPNKPASQSANQFFGVAYEFQDQKSIGETSIGIPHLVEAYVNFGALGVLFIMMMLGMVYAAVDRLLNHWEAGEGAIVIYAVIMTTLWSIETSTAATFGAVIQTILFYTIVFRIVGQRQTSQASFPKPAALNPL